METRGERSHRSHPMQPIPLAGVDISFLEEAQQMVLCHQCEFNPFRFDPFRQVKQTHQLLQITTCRIIRTVNSLNRLTQKGHLFQITRSFGLKEAMGRGGSQTDQVELIKLIREPSYQLEEKNGILSASLYPSFKLHRSQTPKETTQTMYLFHSFGKLTSRVGESEEAAFPTR